MSRVIHTAQALVDLVCEVAALPVRGGNQMASTSVRQPGGAAIILMAAARSGAEAVHTGSMGTGVNADLLREALAGDGVEVSSPAVAEQDSGVCVVMLEPTGERTFVTTWGAERQLTEAALQSSDPRPGDLVCVSGYSLIEPTVGALLPWLEGLPAGVIVVLDPGAIFAELPADVVRRTLAVTSVWSSNMDEATALVGADEMSAAAPLVLQRMAEEHPAQGSGDLVAIVRDGDRGCAVHVDGQTTAVPGFPQKAVDTNGAGDTHTGALCAAVTRGLGWVEASRYANAAAALKVTGRGPASIPNRAAVEELLRQAADRIF